MLTNLHVKNMALISEADVNFENGLNILSGETGAGKSILIGSINLALGARANKDIIRTGCEYALAELTFHIDNERVLDKLKELEVSMDDNELIISRKIYENKSVIRVNGETFSVNSLRQITELLIDVHGQHEHQSLLKPAKHLEILDEYCGMDLAGLQKLYKEYSANKKEYELMNLDEEGRRRQISFLEFEINEIEAAALRDDEEQELLALHKKLSNSVDLLNGAASVYSLMGYDRGAGNQIECAVKTLLGICEYDEELIPLKDQILDIESLVSDFCSEINNYKDNINIDEEELYEVEKRLELIRDLERKYGNTIEAVNNHLADAKKEYAALEDYDNRRAELKQIIDAQEKELSKLCNQISKARKKCALSLEEQITASLKEMNFLDVRFKIDFKETQISSKGCDYVEFLISTNPGEALKPLEKVASGGELSRIMLALKTVLANSFSIETLIFDEIDAGISGITASCVGRKLKSVSKSSQVICISHLPQIVAAAGTHFLIEKAVNNDQTFTSIYKLDEEASVREVARLLGGDKISDNTLLSAKELKNIL